ncbi:MAG: hypothetical protein RLZZ338_628 [Cyanobacteriota bacterium]
MHSMAIYKDKGRRNSDTRGDIPEFKVVKIITLGEVMIFPPFGMEVTPSFSTQKEKGEVSPLFDAV